MKTRTRNILGALGAGVLLTVVTIVANPLIASAWPEPEVEVTPSACVGGVRTTPAIVTLTNLETGYPNSPGVPQVMAVDPEFTWTPFTPDILPNTGDSKATMSVYPPADFEGEIKVAWRLVWAGPDGGDSKSGKVWIQVEKCEPPVTTTTSTTSTSTTSTSTTSTTQPTTTTSSTQPTTTTSTTQPTTTTSTTQPSTTTTTQPSTTSTTMPSTSTTSSTVPETTTTTAPSTTTTAPYECPPPSEQVSDEPVACLIPPVTIEAPPAVAVPTAPRFTG